MSDKLFKDYAAKAVGSVDIAQLFREARAREKEGQINFWIPEDYKARYKRLQKTSNHKLGRLIKHVIMKCIDEADSADEAKAG